MIIEATGHGVNDEISVQADFVVIDGATGIRRENISVPELDHLTSPYPLATRAGQFVFTTPLPASTRRRAFWHKVSAS